MREDNYALVATVLKNTREIIHVALREDHGLDLVDIRIFGVGAGDPEPTGRGVSLRISRLPDLIDALEQARAAARRRLLEAP